MQQSRLVWWSVGSSAIAALIAIAPAQAQILPDATLGTEGSVVVPNQVIKGIPTDRIDGGAIRGSNLFHSFLEFNIGDGQAAYFSNPIGIETILSRVTGSNPSVILGRLGVLGDANLFLLNPNGIVFGSNASLDIAGSLTATTANAVQLGQAGMFSASDPARSSLISIAPGALFFNAVANQPATLSSRATLVTGNALTLSAGNLDLSGQLQAGGDLTLQGTDTVRIRDGVTSPVVAVAGGNLLIQGDRGINIFALNHPNSGFFANQNLVLRSANPVGGDAHYWAGGNVRIEKLDGSLGALFSPYDPIIRASGDVSFDSYSGASLHILAGGSVTIPGTVEITSPDIPGNALVDTIVLSNGTLIAIDGTARPTLDIRAGTTAVGTPGISGSAILPNLNQTATATGASITIGSTVLNQPNGTVLLTNQYQPNLALTGADITIGAIDATNTAGVGGEGSRVAIDTRGNFTLNPDLNPNFTGGFIDTSSPTAAAGDITVLAGGAITLNDFTFLNASDQFSGTATGGSITLSAGGTITLKPFATISSAGSLGGNLVLQSLSDIVLQESNSLSVTNSGSVIGSVGGNIDITARSLSGIGSLITTSSSSNGGSFSQASSGNVTIRATDAIALDMSSITTRVLDDPSTVGNGGDILITAGQLTLTNSTLLNAGTANQGKGGSVNLQITDALTIDNSAVTSRVFDTATGDGGDIQLKARSLVIQNFGSLETETSGSGKAGALVINADTVALRDGALLSSSVGSTAVNGQGGAIAIQSNQLSVTGAAQITARTFGNGNAGTISITADDAVRLSDPGSTISTQTASDTGDGGDIAITTASFDIANQATVDASTIASRPGGRIVVTSDRFNASTGGKLLTSTSNAGDAGDISINTVDRFNLTDADTGIFANATDTATGNGGNIIIDPREVTIARSAGVFVNNQGTGVGGTISIQAGRLTLEDQARLDATTASGRGGNIDLQVTDLLLLRDNSLISTEARQNGDGGNITIEAGFVVAFLPENSDIVADAFQGRGGNITITTQGLFGFILPDRRTDLSDITASSQLGVNGVVQINTPDVDVQSSVTDLSGSFASADQVVAGSCLARRTASRGSFTITGTGGLARTPYDLQTSSRYDVATVQPLPEQPSSGERSPNSSHAPQPTASTWKLGDPVREAQGMIVTPDGQTIIGTGTQLAKVASAAELVCEDTIAPP